MRGAGRIAGAAVAAVLVVAATWLWWPQPAAEPERTSARSAAKAAASGPSLAAKPETSASTANGGFGTHRDAPGTDVLSREEVQALRAELSGRPDADAEFQRIVAYLSFSRHWEAFQAARARGDDPAALRARATALAAALPARWQQGELTGPQALQMKSQLLEVLLSSDAERQTVLKSWREALAPAGGPSPTERQFLEAQAQLLAAYRARPAAQQQAAALKAQLEALREEHFGRSNKP